MSGISGIGHGQGHSNVHKIGNGKKPKQTEKVKPNGHNGLGTPAESESRKKNGSQQPTAETNSKAIKELGKQFDSLSSEVAKSDKRTDTQIDHLAAALAKSDKRDTGRDQQLKNRINAVSHKTNHNIKSLGKTVDKQFRLADAREQDRHEATRTQFTKQIEQLDSNLNSRIDDLAAANDEQFNALNDKIDSGLAGLAEQLQTIKIEIDINVNNTNNGGQGGSGTGAAPPTTNVTVGLSDELTSKFDELTGRLEKLMAKFDDLSDTVAGLSGLTEKYASLVGQLQLGGAAGQGSFGQLNIGRATLSLGSGGSLQRLTAALRFADRGYEHFDKIFSSQGSSPALSDLSSSLSGSLSKIQSQLSALKPDKQSFSLLA